MEDGEEAAAGASLKRKKAVLLVAATAAAAATVVALNAKEQRERRANKVRDRSRVLEKVFEQSEEEFRVAYGITKGRFQWLLNAIYTDIAVTERGKKMARVSSGSSIPPALVLCIALRVIRGASYIDLAFGYCVAKNTVFQITWRVL